MGKSLGNAIYLSDSAEEIVKKVKEEELLETLRQELLHWNE